MVNQLWKYHIEAKTEAMDETVALFKEVLNIPENYHVLFLGGGASTQFNDTIQLPEKESCLCYKGVWSTAIKEAKLFGEVEILLHQKTKITPTIQKDSKFLKM